MAEPEIPDGLPEGGLPTGGPKPTDVPEHYILGADAERIAAAQHKLRLYMAELQVEHNLTVPDVVSITNVVTFDMLLQTAICLYGIRCYGPHDPGPGPRRKPRPEDWPEGAPGAPGAPPEPA